MAKRLPLAMALAVHLFLGTQCLDQTTGPVDPADTLDTVSNDTLDSTAAVDTVGPVLAITHFSDSLRPAGIDSFALISRSGRFTVQGTARDKEGALQRVFLEMGSEADSAVLDDTVWTMPLGVSGRDHHRWRRFTVAALDTQGNRSRALFTVRWDTLYIDTTAPTVIVLSPYPDGSYLHQHSVLVRAKVTDAFSGVEYVTINQGQAEQRDSIWQRNVPLLDTAHGVMTDIEIVAVDRSDRANKTVVSWSARYDTSQSTDTLPPVVRLLEPLPDSAAIPVDTVRVRVRSSDASSGIRWVRINGQNAQALDDSTFSRVVVLDTSSSGAVTTITVVASDRSPAQNCDTVTWHATYVPLPAGGLTLPAFPFIYNYPRVAHVYGPDAASLSAVVDRADTTVSFSTVFRYYYCWKPVPSGLDTAISYYVPDSAGTYYRSIVMERYNINTDSFATSEAWIHGVADAYQSQADTIGHRNVVTVNSNSTTYLGSLALERMYRVYPPGAQAYMDYMLITTYAGKGYIFLAETDTTTLPRYVADYRALVDAIVPATPAGDVVTDAHLYELQLVRGITALAPAFHPLVTSYKATVSGDTVQVVPIRGSSNPSTVVKVDGNVVADGAVSQKLLASSSPFSIEVTAANGTTKKTYTLEVVK